MILIFLLLLIFLPSFEITSQLTNLPNLSDYDVDENLELNINSQYCTVEELAPLQVSHKDISLFHALLSNLNVDFQVLGLSEIKVSNDAPESTMSTFLVLQIPSHSF